MKPGHTYGMMMRIWPDQSYQGSRFITPIDYYSDIAVDFIEKIGSCEYTQQNKWEDTRDSDYSEFVYDGYCDSSPRVDEASVRLVN